MKKRKLWLFSGLICAVLALCGIPAHDVNAAGQEKAAGSVNEVKQEKTSGSAGVVGTVNAEASGTGAGPVYDAWISCGDNDKYFRLATSHGGMVTYTQDKNVIAAECDKEGSETEPDIYYFKIPKKGKMEIKVRFEDGTVTTLEAINGGTYKEVNKGGTRVWRCKAKYEPDASGYKYGRITGTVEGLDYAEYNSDYYGNDNIWYDFMARVKDPTISYDYGYAMYYEGWMDDYFDAYKENGLYNHSGSCMPVYLHYIKNGKEVDDVEMMNNFLKPLYRNGATVIVESCYGSGTYNGSKEVYYNNYVSYDGKRLESSKEIIIYKRKSVYKAAKIKIPKQKNPPKVKVDAVKGTIGVSDKMEIRFASLDADGKLGAYDEWRKAEKKMSIDKVSDSSIASGGVIQVRFPKTNKALYSKTLCIDIPSKTAIDVEKIKWEGTITNGSITISDYDKTSKPYEYTLDTPGESTKWISVKSGKIVFKGKNSLTDASVVYIRERGINANDKKKIKLKLPSTIATVSVSGGAVSQENIKPYDKEGGYGI